MKMSAALIRHKSQGRPYDIDGFISQLLSSRKFDELAEKLAEKAANKLMHIDAAPSLVERATYGNETDNSTESAQEVIKKQSNREDVANKYEKTQSNNVELKKDFTGKIDPQTVINAIISLSENLQLKYKYFKKNALEKKVKSIRVPKNDTKEGPSKLNKTKGPTNFKEHNTKTQELISHQSATEENQMDAEKESIDENKRSRDDTKNGDPKEDSIRNSEINESCHSGMDDETNVRSKKSGQSLEEHEQTVFREAQISRQPEVKGIVEEEVSNVDNGIRGEKGSSLEEDNQKHLTRSEENIIEEVEKTEGEPEKRGTKEINEDDNVIAQFRAREDSFVESKVTSDYNPHGDVYRSKASDDRDDLSPEEQPPEFQSSKEQSGEDPNTSKLKPMIRKEGDKLYTYVRAPEYEDYYEKLSKWQKEHTENPADFMK